MDHKLPLYFLSLTLFFFNLSTEAQELSPLCSSFETVGESCQTTKGVRFTLIANAPDYGYVFQNESNGLIWTDRILVNRPPYNYKKATGLCESLSTEKFQFRLPTKAELEQANNDGFLQLKSQKPTDEACYWSNDNFNHTRFGFINFHLAWVLCQHPKHGTWTTTMNAIDMLSVRCVASPPEK